MAQEPKKGSIPEVEGEAKKDVAKEIGQEDRLEEQPTLDLDDAFPDRNKSAPAPADKKAGGLTLGGLSLSGGEAEVRGTLVIRDERAATKEPAEPVDKGDIVKNASGKLFSAKVGAAKDILRDGGDGTAPSPVPNRQSDPGGEDPMKRQPGEAPGPSRMPGTKPYVLNRPYWDGTAMHARGEVMGFEPGKEPARSRPVE